LCGREWLSGDYLISPVFPRLLVNVPLATRVVLLVPGSGEGWLCPPFFRRGIGALMAVPCFSKFQAFSADRLDPDGGCVICTFPLPLPFARK